MCVYTYIYVHACIYMLVYKCVYTGCFFFKLNYEYWHIFKEKRNFITISSTSVDGTRVKQHHSTEERSSEVPPWYTHSSWRWNGKKKTKSPAHSSYVAVSWSRSRPISQLGFPRLPLLAVPAAVHGKKSNNHDPVWGVRAFVKMLWKKTRIGLAVHTGLSRPFQIF